MPSSDKPSQICSRSTVSVIIPCYNAAKTVAETIQSILGQTYPAIEIIVADDGSTDNSREIVYSFGDRIHFVQCQHGGGSHARNEGVKLAGGEYLMFLDSDDVIGPDAIAGLVDSLANAPGAIAACPWQRLVFRNGIWTKEHTEIPATPPGGDILAAWLLGWYCPPCGILWTREAFDRTGPWDETISTNDDGELMLRAFIRGVRLVNSNTGEALYRARADGQVSVGQDLSPRAYLSQVRVLDKTETLLKECELYDKYAKVLGRAYYNLARKGYTSHQPTARDVEFKAYALAGREAITGVWQERLLAHLVGLKRSSLIVQRYQVAKRAWKRRG
jgi:glycosyltransferase involved in cell wall biosynthesis